MRLCVSILNGSLCKARFKTLRSRIGRRTMRHPHRTPWVPNGTGQRCVGRNIVPKPYSLGYWQNGSWARVRKQGVAHCRPMDLRNRRKRKLLFLWEGGYQWPLDQRRNRNKMKQKILLLDLHRGKERRSSCRLPRQGRFVDFLDNLGPGWDSGGAALLREARRAGLCVD